MPYMEIPSYSRLNEFLGLPDQSRALDEAVSEFGDDLPRLLDVAYQTAPFLFKLNFFINNMTFFLRHLDRSQQIFRKFNRIAAQKLVVDLPDDFAVFHLLSDALSTLRINKKIGRDLPRLLEAMDAFLSRLLNLASRGVRLTVKRFYELLGILNFCRSQEEVDKIIAEITQGKSIQQAIQDSGVKPAKYHIAGLKILDGCTIQCRYCCEKAKANREEWNVMTVDDLKKLEWLLDDIIQTSVSGGEPFLSPHLFEIMRYLEEKGASVAFLTSGGEIEDLEKMLPFFKSGTVSRIDLSMHDAVGPRGKRRFESTTAFLVQHNIPFVIVPKITGIGDVDCKAVGIRDRLGALGLATTGEFVQQGKNRLVPYYPNSHMALYRDPLVLIENTLIMPSAKLTDPAALENLQALVRMAVKAGYKPSQLCRFGNLDFRSDKTVSACDAIVGPLRCKRLMDHWPKSESELDESVKRYRERMQAIWDEADRRACSPCQVHLEQDASYP